MKHTLLAWTRLACAVVLVVLLVSVAGKGDLEDAYVRGAMENDARPRRALGMPPADPIFEAPHELIRLTPPVSCVRLEGVHGMGREWIRSWGDGAAPPAMPTCVRASSEGGTTTDV